MSAKDSASAFCIRSRRLIGGMFAIAVGVILFAIVKGKMRKKHAHVILRVVILMIPLSKQQHRKLNHCKGKGNASFFDANFRNRHQMHCSLAPRFVRVIPPPIPLSQSFVLLSSIVVYHHVAALNRAFTGCSFLLDELFSTHNSPIRWNSSSCRFQPRRIPPIP